MQEELKKEDRVFKTIANVVVADKSPSWVGNCM